MALRAAVFDFDGVIVDSEPLHFRSLRDALLDDGVTITREEYWGSYLAYDDRAAIRLALEHHGQPAPPERADADRGRKIARFAELIPEMPVFDGAPRAGARARRRAAARDRLRRAPRRDRGDPDGPRPARRLQRDRGRRRRRAHEARPARPTSRRRAGWRQGAAGLAAGRVPGVRGLGARNRVGARRRDEGRRRREQLPAREAALGAPGRGLALGHRDARAARAVRAETRAKARSDALPTPRPRAGPALRRVPLRLQPQVARRPGRARARAARAGSARRSPRC